jgi:hypothetical protein
MSDVVKLPAAPEWAKEVDTKFLDGLIAKGYLRLDQRRDWGAIEQAINKAFVGAVFDGRPELSVQNVLGHMRAQGMLQKDEPA